MADDIAFKIGVFAKVVNVHFAPDALCGLLLQVGRWHTGGGTRWQLLGTAGPSPEIFGGEFQGTATGFDRWNIGEFEDLALALPKIQTVVVGEDDFAGNSGNLAVAFNFTKMKKAGVTFDEIVDLSLIHSVLATSNSSQWHIGVDAFKLVPEDSENGEKIALPNFTTYNEPDNPSAKFGDELLGLAPMRRPDSQILGSARVYIPHTSGEGIYFGSTNESRVNTLKGELLPALP